MAYYVLNHKDDESKYEYFNLYCLGKPEVLLHYSGVNGRFGNLYDSEPVENQTRAEIDLHFSLCIKPVVMPAALFFNLGHKYVYNGKGGNKNEV